MNQAVIDAQRQYTQARGVPFFMPADGRCFRCGKDITERITIERASSELITGCPHCSWSYVD